MNCKDCKNAFVGKEKGDISMNKLGYKSCKLASTPVERATYVRGSQVCLWIDRLK